MERVNACILACFISVSVALIAVLVSPFQKAPGVDSKQQTEHRVTNQDRPTEQAGQPRPAESFFAEIVPFGAEKKGQAEGQHGSEEGTEFWPPLLGYRLKITDTLIAFFTAGLFVATWFLWLATRGLVSGADRTAERQLRAYVFVQAQNIHISDDTIAVRYEFRNTGQTPAYNVRHAGKLEILPSPLPADFVIVSPTDLGGGNSLGNGVPYAGESKILYTGTPAALKVDKTRIYLIVIVKYFDAFKRERTTRLAVSVANFDAMVEAIIDAAQSGKTSGAMPNIEFEHLNQHNDSD